MKGKLFLRQKFLESGKVKRKKEANSGYPRFRADDRWVDLITKESLICPDEKRR